MAEFGEALGLNFLALHAPDGFFSLPIIVLGWVFFTTAIASSVRSSRNQIEGRLVPLTGVMAAFTFGAQLLNFPVPVVGVSVHLIGGALAAITLGLPVAILALASVTTLQALLFQDGGLIALGANSFNLAVLAPVSAWVVHRVTLRFANGRGREWIAAFLAGWVSVMVVALAVALELGLSQVLPLGLLLYALLATHALLGLAEGAITAGAVVLFRRMEYVH